MTIKKKEPFPVENSQRREICSAGTSNSQNALVRVSPDRPTLVLNVNSHLIIDYGGIVIYKFEFRYFHSFVVRARQNHLSHGVHGIDVAVMDFAGIVECGVGSIGDVGKRYISIPALIDFVD